MSIETIEAITAIGAMIWVFGALAAFVAALSEDDFHFAILGFFWPITLPAYGAVKLVQRVRKHTTPKEEA